MKSERAREHEVRRQKGGWADIPENGILEHDESAVDRQIREQLVTPVGSRRQHAEERRCTKPPLIIRRHTLTPVLEHPLNLNGMQDELLPCQLAWS